MTEISRAFDSIPLSGVMQTSTEFSSRILSSIQNSDTNSLAFALTSLIFSTILMCMNQDKLKGTNNPVDLIPPEYSSRMNLPPMEENEILEHAFQKSVNRKGNLYSKEKTELEKLQTKKEKKEIGLKDYEKAVRKFVTLIQWSQNMTRNEDLFENMLQWVTQKTKGKQDPSDEFLEIASAIVIDTLDIIYGIFNYLFN